MITERMVRLLYIVAILIRLAKPDAPYPKITVSVFPTDNDERQVFINGSSEPVKKGDWILLTCLAEYPHRIISTPFNSKVRIPRNNA